MVYIQNLLNFVKNHFLKYMGVVFIFILYYLHFIFYYTFIIAKYDELSRDKYPKMNRKYLCNVHK